MPYYVYAAPDGERVALPCTERLYSERQAAQVASYRVMPLTTLRGRPEVRLPRVLSVAGGPLAGFWAPVTMPAPGAQPVAAAPAVEPEPDQVADEPSEPEDTATPETETASEAAPVEEEATEDDLDALLASLSAPAPAAEEGSTEVDLDALLASL